MSYKDRNFVADNDHIATFVDKTNKTIQRVGDLTNISASVQVDSDLVSAIGSIADSIGTGALDTTATTLKGAINEIDGRLDSDTTNLQTLNSHRDSNSALIGTASFDTTATTITGAINEHEADIGNMTFTGLSATDISGAIRELRTELGDHSSLTTTATTDVVSAINEINSELYASPDGSGSDFNTTATTIEGAINELDSDIGEIVNLSDSVREGASDAVSAINYVWQFAKQVDNDQTTADNLLGNLSTLDNEIERTSFALSINSLRDSVNNLTDSLNNVIYSAGGAGINTRIQNLIDSTNKIGAEANKGINYNQTTRKFSIDDEIDAGSDTITFKNGVNTFATFTRFQDSDLRISAGDAGSSGIVIADSSITIDGDLRVTGTSIFTETETVVVANNIIQLNANLTGNPAVTDDAGIEVNRGAFTDVQLVWDESENKWVAAYDSDNNLSPIVVEATLSSADGALTWTGSQIAHRVSSVDSLNNSNLTFIQNVNFDSHGHAISIANHSVAVGTALQVVNDSISHTDITRTDTTTGDSTLVPSGTIELISAVSSNSQGHVTATNTPTFTMPAIGETLEIRNAAGTLLKTIKSYT